MHTQRHQTAIAFQGRDRRDGSREGRCDRRVDECVNCRAVPVSSQERAGLGSTMGPLLGWRWVTLYYH
jgi:hypothetical protein